MMAQIIWPESYPDLVARARRYHANGWFIDARADYLNAAAVAPSVVSETDHLESAWVCEERAAGRVSELERNDLLGDVA